MVSLASLGPDSIVGCYRIVKELGRGGMGTVYEAVHTLLPRKAAIKIMHAELLRQPGMATRMVQEACILEELKRHAGIVRVFECGLLADHRPYIVMELIEGESLAARLHRVPTLPSVEVAKVLADVATVLAAVHQTGIVHRDLKPDNVLLTPRDELYPLRIIDWGVARLGPMGRLTLDGMTPGTPIYMSPEQATGRNIGPACDIYSLGVMAYEMLTGHPPFDGRTLAEVVCMHLTSDAVPLQERTCAPIELCELVHRMLEKDPQARPSAHELRRRARALASPAGTYDGTDYAEMSIEPIRTVRSHAPAVAQPVLPEPVVSEEVVIVDPDALEFGITEMQPVVRRPRWTPDISQVVQAVITPARTQAITPRSHRDQVAGEIVLLEKRR
jgi:serine/threonine protein kinase